MYQPEADIYFYTKVLEVTGRISRERKRAGEPNVTAKLD